MEGEGGRGKSLPMFRACQTVQHGPRKSKEEKPQTKKKQEKIKHDQTEAATKQIYVFGQKKKRSAREKRKEMRAKGFCAAESGKLREINKEIMFNFRRGKEQSNATSCAWGDFHHLPRRLIYQNQSEK